jgi:hypothetical protein
MTLIELLLASVIMAMIAGGIAALSLAVQTGNSHNASMSRTLQHGRVVTERLEHSLRGATTSQLFPGFVAFSETIDGFEFPDTLVVWNPEGAPSDPDGLPLFSELLVYCVDPDAPERLLEIRSPSDNRTVPPLANINAWQTALDDLRNDASADRVTLTDLIRVAKVADAIPPRAAMRFQVLLRPSGADWSEFKASATGWEDIAWPQDIYGSRSGLRQSWCRFEMQLRPADGTDHSADAAIPFFGSAVVFYQLKR